ncbi:MAG: NAD(P)/FAD-dependent oxidoreductase [Bacteroidetes bacterium]|nr:MAG: NAD(P)/FAD-dependent oxidoreductase [Bacteroidota bacterium]
MKTWDAIVIGGGAAGFFGAIRLAELRPSARVCILEQGAKVLQKVRISGGGRCNVTHACFDPVDLAANYPRGQKELIGPFHRFQPADTMDWYESRGVRLKIEEDGRVFPVSDDSADIVRCLVRSARKAGVAVHTRHGVADLHADGARFDVGLRDGTRLQARMVLVAPGASRRVWEMLARLGHTIVPPVPSLFTFNIGSAMLRGLAGVSVPMAVVRVPEIRLEAPGPVLITHWGLSGPAVLRLSAWGARRMHELNYRFSIEVDWCGGRVDGEVLGAWRQQHARKKVVANPAFDIPRRLWKGLCTAAGIGPEKNWADLSRAEQADLLGQLTACRLPVQGKSTHKEEFVTAGGVALKEVDFRRFESRVVPGLFLAGEVLDIDAITGGFNFQAAWTGGWLAGSSMAERL